MAVTKTVIMCVEMTVGQATPTDDQMSQDIMSVIVKGTQPGWLVSVDSAWVDVKRRYEIVNRA